MTTLKFAFAAITGLCLFSCSVLDNNSSKYNFSDGYYYSRLDKKKKAKYYLLTGGDSIKVFPASVSRQIADTVKSITLLFPPHEKPLHFSNYYFLTRTFDIDFLSTLFKFRPAVKDFSQQLNATFNGSVYAGFRKDMYKLSYTQTPLHTQNRKISHYGYSVGGFLGIGTVRIDQSLTLNRIDYEYDGAALNAGLAGIFAFNKLNFGINCGVDYLTDKNRRVWVNQAKPWIGLSVGLNLN
ncbi:MAG: hypothetical protein QM802_02665 [Agriterribacter sp.]